MLKEVTKTEWLSFLNIPEDAIPEVLLLRGTRNLKGNYAKHRAFFDDVLEVGSKIRMFEDVLIGVHKSIPVGYASVYGDAMACEITHVFGVLGTSLVIQTGCCGALAEGILPGDLVCATSARCGEGASQYYLPGRHEVQASVDLVDRITTGSVGSLGVHKGPIWTTSALLAEGRREIECWSSQGYVAVDMETASTFAVAEYFRMRRLSLLFVFDTPRQGAHILLAGPDSRERRAQGEQAMIDMVFAIIHACTEASDMTNDR